MKKFVRSRVIREREINMISTNKAIAGVVLVTLLNGFISVNLFKEQNKFYTNEVDKLLMDNQKLHTELEQFYKYGVEVNVTMYQPVYPQTDNTPDITDDGTRIRINKASEYKFVALSRNLLKRWGGPFDYGDFILIKGTKNFHPGILWMIFTSPLFPKQPGHAIKGRSMIFNAFNKTTVKADSVRNRQ